MKLISHIFLSIFCTHSGLLHEEVTGYQSLWFFMTLRSFVVQLLICFPWSIIIFRYASILAKHPWIAFVSTFLMVLLAGTTAFVKELGAKPLPDFSSPSKVIRFLALFSFPFHVNRKRYCERWAFFCVAVMVQKIYIVISYQRKLPPINEKGFFQLKCFKIMNRLSLSLFAFEKGLQRWLMIKQHYRPFLEILKISNTIQEVSF